MTTITRIQPVLFEGGKGQPYITPIGQLPSVTTILRETMNPETRAKFAAMRGRRPKPGAVDPAERGTLVHGAIESLLKGEPASLPQSCVPYYESVLPVLKGIKPVALEACVFHPKGFAGRLDALVEADGNLILLDWKTSSKPFLHLKDEAYLKEICEWDERIEDARIQESDKVLSSRAASALIRKINAHRQRVVSDFERFEDYLCQVAAYVQGANHTYNLEISHAWVVLILPGEPAQVVKLSHQEIASYWQIFQTRLTRFQESHEGMEATA